MNANRGIEGRNLARCSYGLGQRFGGIVFIKEYLPLEVARFHVIAVNDSQMAHARASQQAGHARTGGPAAYNSHAGGGEFFLPFGFNPSKQDLPRITVLECHSGIYYKCETQGRYPLHLKAVNLVILMWGLVS